MIIVFSTIVYNSCSSESSAQDTETVSLEHDNSEPSKDVTRLKNLYIDFNLLSEYSISQNRIEPSDIHKLNLIIRKLNFFVKSYELKYYKIVDGNELFTVLLNDSETHDIISKYILLSSQMKDIDGYQYIKI